MIYDPYRITSLHQKSTFPMSNWIWIITQHNTRRWRHRATPKRMCISFLKSALGEKWRKRASNRSRKATLIFLGRESRPLRRAYFRKLAPTPIAPTILFPWANDAFPRGFFCSAPVRGRLAPPVSHLDGWTAHAHAAANGGEERGEGERGWFAVWNSPRDGGHSRALGGLSAWMPSSWWSVDLMSSESPACSDARWSSPQCNCACVRQQAMIYLLLESGWADKRKEYIPRRKGSTFFYYV
jgi:hypothetical protein